jgi:Aerobic-type carbon monoxide dehydrogenase, middle subunit CoxM/CutM homologs
MEDDEGSLMYPARFDYYRPSTLNEVLELMEEGCRPMAGGQSLLPMMKLRLLTPNCLVDLGEIEELRGIAVYKDTVKIGAMVTHNEIEESQEISSSIPVLAQTAANIGDLQVRMRGTIGGSVSHADPSANYLPTLLALDAKVKLVSKSGRRSLPLQEFVRGPLLTGLKQGELVEAVEVPIYGGNGLIRKFSRRKADFAIAIVTLLYKKEERRLNDVRVAVGALRTGPRRLTKLEESLNGRMGRIDVSDILIREVKSLEPVEDLHGGVEYRRNVILTLITRMMEELWR